MLGRRIIALHVWAVHQGLCGAPAAAGEHARLVTLGRHTLRGVREPREIYALEPGL